MQLLKKKKINKFIPKKNKTSDGTYDPTKLEENSLEVQARFQRGCECQDDQCFKGLNPDAVYKHRLNIADLTKAEHDMYLMGLIRSCLTNPYETNKHTERQRLRAQYVYQGRRVCLDAFLYLENCTYYQIKRIRKHLITNGVTPRVHGNYGKVPHNTFSLDIYQIATNFLKNFIKEQEIKQKTKAANNSPLYLPADVTRKTVHDLYKDYCQHSYPNVKCMGYATFRTFLKVQFRQLKFSRLEFVIRAASSQNQNNLKSAKTYDDVLQTTEIVNEKGELIPVIFTNETGNETETYIWTNNDGVSYQVTKSNIILNKADEPLTIANITPVNNINRQTSKTAEINQLH